MWDKLNCKKLLLVRFEILRLFLNRMTTDDKISHRNRHNFGQQIQMQLSQQQNSFLLFFFFFFFAFLKCTSNFQHFETNEESHSLSISEIRWLLKSLKFTVSEHLSSVNVLTRHNHC